MVETDWVVGQVMKAVDDAKIKDNTLLSSPPTMEPPNSVARQRAAKPTCHPDRIVDAKGITGKAVTVFPSSPAGPGWWSPAPYPQTFFA